MITNRNKHPFLGADIGELEVVTYHADNEIFGKELRFFVPACEWSEFENSQLFQALTDYVQYLAKRIPKTHSCSHGNKCKLEIPPCVENSIDQDSREWPLGLIRKALRKWKYR